MNDQFNIPNPRLARSIEELENMEREYDSWLYTQQQLESLSKTQNEISNEMSKYGSNLIPTLTTCGVVGCLGVTGCLINKCCDDHYEHRHTKNNDYGFEIPRPRQQYLPEIIDLTDGDDPSEEFLYENITVKQEPK